MNLMIMNLGVHTVILWCELSCICVYATAAKFFACISCLGANAANTFT